MRHLGTVALAALLITACQDATAPRDVPGIAHQLTALATVNFVVNSTADAVDASVGDGLCATATGTCTLRAAIMETNALTGDDAVSLPAGTYLLDVLGPNEDVGATGDLDITGNLTIQGAGAAQTIIDGNGSVVNDRVFHVTGAFDVNVSGVTIRGGIADAGGGIITANGASVTLTNTAISGNSTPFGNGGGVYADGGTLALINSTVSGNTAPAGVGGGLFTSGTTTLTNSTVDGNVAIGGGGIFNFPSSALTVVKSTVSGNRATASFGGGISNLGALTLANSTVSGNSADFNGGGISNEIGSLMVTHSTITRNRAGNNGGGLFNGSTTTFRNTLVADNPSGGNCAGGIIDGGGNLTWPDITCPGLSADPLLGTLANNGGPTETHAVVPGSAAIDAAVNGNCSATDQRGVARPQGQGCDIGAFELQAATVIEVAIDIKPNSIPSSINPESSGVVPLAILTTAAFDATTVDPLSVRFGPSSAAEVHNRGHFEDVDGDGDIDLLLHFRVGSTGIRCGDASASIRGETLSGQIIQGSDSFRTVGCPTR
jgi:CSLREA domain-containing protein